MRKMDRIVQIVHEKYYPKWNSTRITLELLRPIGQHATLTPAGEFAQIIVETGIIYSIPLEAHVTMSSTDINGRSLWVNTYKEKPLLLGDLYNPDRENTFNNVFDTLYQSNAVLEFGIGTKIIVNYYVVPADIRQAYTVLWDR